MNSLAGKLASGIARLIPSGKQVEDPLASIKSATRWLETLPIGDAYKCQQAILNELKRFNENASPFTKDQLSVLMLLDEKSRDLQDTLVRQYLRNPRMSRLVESQLWHAIYGMYWEIARSYHTFVLHFSRGAGKSAHEDQIPLITLRAIQTFGQLLKWRTLRYLPAGEKLWLRLHNLYRVAETEDFHRRPQRAYVDSPKDASCESAYTHIMMLDLANSGSLYPKQIDLLDRWLCNWHDMFQLDARVDNNHTFVIDLSADHGPRRVRKPNADRPLRFWTTAELLFELNELQTALRGGKAPSTLGLTDAARTVESLELLEHLQHHWASLSSREQRRAPRETIKRLVDVTHGFSAIVDQVKLASSTTAVSPYGNGLNYDEVEDVHVYGFITERTRERITQLQMPVHVNSPDVERWVMHDESECGYGAIVESRDKDWLRVGALVCAKVHDATTWQLGIIRRLSRLNDDTSSVGIETVAETPVLAMLYDTSVTASYTVDGFDNTGASLPHPALWLEGGNGPHSVIIDPVNFIPGKVLQIHGVAEFKFIALANPVERSEGWIRVAIEPVSK